ncbi:UDP-N-acetylmuramoyl-L-alanyl-D-glutamate--2,6-diaminopimelate ligase [Pelodictyon luteolum]|uniref:UDP-N-acetylmuramoyl-L-alanyl-D-glutamate--2,6-diaminopimelate ligase n=1 Tax=Chlorobium luteolum (strain DSM 273 / BCRC 81028 / 2530) TaxID=319225 RepID=Q3B124_CHLL3|nr:UDP-N-acetylmuramoyl-L-alanyl-D-glutamate--2,6-diaminopimelate ligase [Pelodictyon luteolum]ABB24957.1 UDP-N-acetylmuramoylalanyl-D-glutamate--2,6-diaminopimelate ligase [Pelodictyon luteolum DSM 273]
MNPNTALDGMQPVALREILRGMGAYEVAAGQTDGVMVRMLTNDSRVVEPGSLFVAVRGFAADGRGFIKDAIARGASAVVSEDFPMELALNGPPCIRVPDARRALSLAAAAYYGHPADRLRIVGVTGTNGKTTTARLISSILSMNGISCGYIGTGKAIIGDREIPLERTTPEAHGLHRLFRMMVDGGCRAVSMEVSSHALELGRVHGIAFQAAVFTNLTPDHLDFHPSMESYAEAKRKLFDQLAPGGIGIFNTEDPMATFMAARVAEEQRACCSLDAAGFGGMRCGLNYGAMVRREGVGSSVVALSFPEGVQPEEEFRLLGRFNVMNMLEAAAAAHQLGVPARDVAASLPGLQGVEGRMEQVEGPGFEGTAIVDYAHTPDALHQSLGTLRELLPPDGRLLVVFGCGGNRDRQKRPEMGRIAIEMADFSVITSDNPRDEDPEAILDEIEGGMGGGEHLRIPDRAEAIRTAVGMLRSGDILLVAGKGHECYQETHGRREHFSDREVLAAGIAQENGEKNPEQEARE